MAHMAHHNDTHQGIAVSNCKRIPCKAQERVERSWQQ